MNRPTACPFHFSRIHRWSPWYGSGTVWHLHSLRWLRADQGWIKTLLEGSYNEIMHLLTFLELYRPGPLMRLLVFAAQGIFYNCLALRTSFRRVSATASLNTSRPSTCIRDAWPSLAGDALRDERTRTFVSRILL